MKRVITQEAFNETVRENMTELEMSPEEAIIETVEQYELQGVDLTNIIKTLEMIKGEDPLKTLVNDLISIDINNSTPEERTKTIDTLIRIRKLCSSDLAYKMLAGKSGVYRAILMIMKDSAQYRSVHEASLETLIEVMDGYPDLLDDYGIEYVTYSLANEPPKNTVKLLLQWVHVSCVRHENNRTKFFEKGIVDCLKVFIKPETEGPVLKAACSVMTALTLDDDVRALIPNSHAHACTLAEAFMVPLINIMKTVKDESVLSEAVNALCAVIVRNEFCQSVSTNGGIEITMELLNDYKANQVLVKRLVKLLTNLAGNDNVKDDIMKLDAPSKLTVLLNENLGEKNILNAVLLLISKLSLRIDKYGLAFIDCGTVELIVQVMNTYSDNAPIQKSGCWALRNISSRNKERKDFFLDLGVEAMMNRLMAEYEDVAEDATAVLISLGCQVRLVERWTGKSGDKLSHE